MTYLIREAVAALFATLGEACLRVAVRLHRWEEPSDDEARRPPELAPSAFTSGAAEQLMRLGYPETLRRLAGDDR